MKILIDALSARGGGGITYIKHIIPALAEAKLGYNFYILLSRHYQKDLIRTLANKVSSIIVDVPAIPLKRWWFTQTKIPQILKEGKFDLLFTVTEIGCFRAPVPHVVMVRNFNIYAPLSIFPKWDQRLRLLSYRALRWPMAYLTLWSADRIVFVSNSFREQVLTQLHLPVEKTRVVYHGLNPMFFERNPDKKEEDTLLRSKIGKSPYLLAVSVICAHKNYETLLDAFAQVLQVNPDWNIQLVIAGGVSDYKVFLSLQKQVMDLGIMDRVHFLGAVEYERLPYLYRNALLFVFPSRLESFGLPLVEAMASGVPIVASDLPICREICQNAALYFNMNDASELANRIITLIKNPKLRQQLTKLGVERAKNFSWERTAIQMIEIFEEAISAYRSYKKKEEPKKNQ